VVFNRDTLSLEQELMQDLVAIPTVFSARFHGLRSYKKRMKDAALHKDQT
jgi:putative resolvase